jgi:hypothetical protein
MVSMGYHKHGCTKGFEPLCHESSHFQKVFLKTTN